MSKTFVVIPVLLICMLFNGNLSSLVGFVLNSCEMSTVVNQSSLTLETDGDADVDDHLHLFAFHSPTTSSKTRTTDSLPVVVSSPHDLIYALQNLRI